MEDSSAKAVPKMYSRDGTTVATSTLPMIPFMQTLRVPLALLAAASMAGAAGCRRDEVTHYRVKKASGASFARAVAPGVPPAAPSADLPPPPAPAGGSTLKWALPRGWTESAPGGMRYATLKPPLSGHIDVSVVVLPGPAGGELANVNRWRGQLGLPAIDEATLAAARKPVKSSAGIVSLYDFQSGGEKKSRMVAGLLVVHGSTWFVKMMGDDGTVAAARPDFLHLLQSLHVDAND